MYRCRVQQRTGRITKRVLVAGGGVRMGIERECEAGGLESVGPGASEPGAWRTGAQVGGQPRRRSRPTVRPWSGFPRGTVGRARWWRARGAGRRSGGGFVGSLRHVGTAVPWQPAGDGAGASRCCRSLLWWLRQRGGGGWARPSLQGRRRGTAGGRVAPTTRLQNPPLCGCRVAHTRLRPWLRSAAPSCLCSLAPASERGGSGNQSLSCKSLSDVSETARQPR